MPGVPLYFRETVAPRMSSEERGAVEALQRLRAESRRTKCRHFRAVSLAEAEAVEMDNRGTCLAFAREHSLTGHAAAKNHATGGKRSGEE